MTIGEIIRHEREKLSMTQKDLAQKTGFSIGAISLIESGNSSGNLFTIQTLLSVFDKRLEVVGND